MISDRAARAFHPQPVETMSVVYFDVCAAKFRAARGVDGASPCKFMGSRFEPMKACPFPLRIEPTGHNRLGWRDGVIQVRRAAPGRGRRRVRPGVLRAAPSPW